MVLFETTNTPRPLSHYTRRLHLSTSALVAALHLVLGLEVAARPHREQEADEEHERCDQSEDEHDRVGVLLGRACGRRNKDEAPPLAGDEQRHNHRDSEEDDLSVPSIVRRGLRLRELGGSEAVVHDHASRTIISSSRHCCSEDSVSLLEVTLIFLVCRS